VPAPVVAGPEDLAEGELFGFGGMFDLRRVPDTRVSRDHRVMNRYWARSRTPLPDDPLLHLCVLTFLSDVGSAIYALPPSATAHGGPSLDHAMWFHAPDVRCDDWLLFDLVAIRLARGRSYYTGSMYDRAGRLVASLAQEHLWRELRYPPGTAPPTPPDS
jgi:acyl-CoA thioesterase II